MAMLKMVLAWHIFLLALNNIRSFVGNDRECALVNHSCSMKLYQPQFATFLLFIATCLRPDADLCVSRS